jgi:hypothetical protein
MATSKPQTNMNESGSYRIVHATRWSKGGRIDKPMRLVVIAFVSGGYAVREQDKSGATFGGSSFQSKESAHNAFLKRYLNHNESYRRGNVSHYPGIVK